MFGVHSDKIFYGPFRLYDPPAQNKIPILEYSERETTALHLWRQLINAYVGQQHTSLYK